MFACRIAAEAFDPDREMAGFRRRFGSAGAIVSFLGQVRSESKEGEAVRALTLDHYPAMTLPQIERIAADAAARWDIAGGLVVHRVGRMEPGDPIVLVAVASAHRRAAFEACDFLMDYLKSRASFWKSEETGSGRVWIEPTDADVADIDRWG